MQPVSGLGNDGLIVSFESNNVPKSARDRGMIRAQVIELTINALPSEFVLKGSFSRGDFHWCQERDLSLSDVDLIYPHCGSHESRRASAIEIEERLLARGRLALTVTIQPFDMFLDQPPDVARLVAVCEWLRRSATRGSSEYHKSYDLAKACLAVQRTASTMSFPELAAAYGANSAAAAALDVKLGTSADFSPTTAVSLLVAIEPSEEIEWFKDLVCRRLVAADFEDAARRVRSCLSIPLWMREVLEGLLNDGAMRVKASEA